MTSTVASSASTAPRRVQLLKTTNTSSSLSSAMAAPAQTSRTPPFGATAQKKRTLLQEVTDLSTVKRKKAVTSNGFQKTKDIKEIEFEAKYFNPLQPLDNYCPVYDFGGSKMTDDGEDSVQHENIHPRVIDEIGTGYDSQDSFVDNTDSVPEAMIPPGWTTQLGGYYIGSGKLYIRPISPDELETGLYTKKTAAECKKAMRTLKAPVRKRPNRSEVTGTDAVVADECLDTEHSIEV
ncbi:yemanuclein-like [Paramacrobiotus metropolitanus]|uniref:yemanuclein-like n=1 Tax=Paramacrobiotus metropolitanus TaxID=2943436 RepID=UPI002446246E|nr:yemanuclein-like [Paramacrobiotus metropolitanus]XP_055335235.1 yemanuclein-like [Paramacrobiotus metropolitanus]XP_055335236.1 yemanuclein-like [Paramacrobiotus metropolitanus]